MDVKLFIGCFYMCFEVKDIYSFESVSFVESDVKKG